MKEPAFWMDGYFASNPIEVHHDLAVLDRDLDDESFWAIAGSYEGEWEVIRFREIEARDRIPQSVIDQDGPRKQVWKSSFDRQRYLDYVEKIRDEIKAGWVYQVNACRLLESDDDIDLANLFASIQANHPAPSAAYYHSNRWEIASASPETFFNVTHATGKRLIQTSPIKGTSRDGVFREKDQAENVMIVDLMRNDISPLCRKGSVIVPRLLGVEEHPGLFHLVSDVQGELREDVTFAKILKRLSPAGSITGAPKSSAREVISRFEPYRGIYCGTIGWIYQGAAHFSVAIRTFFKDKRRANQYGPAIYFGTGAGITWGSSASDEWDETELKAERLMRIAAGQA
jgi:para-aminobenzoate synthetase component 1